MYRGRWSYAIAMKLPASAGLSGGLGALALAVEDPITDSKASDIENLQRWGEVAPVSSGPHRTSIHVRVQRRLNNVPETNW